MVGKCILEGRRRLFDLGHSTQGPRPPQSHCETRIIEKMMEPSSSFASLMQLGSDAQMSGSDYVGTSFEHYRLLAEINGEQTFKKAPYCQSATQRCGIGKGPVGRLGITGDSQLFTGEHASFESSTHCIKNAL